MLFRGTGRFKRLTYGTRSLLFLGVVGFVFVVIGQHGEKFNVSENDGILFGAFLALMASITNSFSPAFGIKHAVKSSKNIENETNIHISEIFCSLISLAIQRLVSAIALLTATLLLNEEWTMSIFSAGILAGVVISSISGYAIRKANLITDNLAVNALRYTTPLFSLLWLIMFSNPEFYNWEYMAVGFFAIITANLLINFDSKINDIGKTAIALSGISLAVICFLFNFYLS